MKSLRQRDWKRSYRLLAAGCGVLACVLPLQAAERVYLRTGSNIVCDHQRNVDGRVRLYLTASNDNYTDIDPAQILRTEALAIQSKPVIQAPTAKRPAAGANFNAANLSALLDRAGANHHIDPDLLASMVKAESGGHAMATSHAGARGLMQLMPATAADLGVRDSLQPEQNVAGGTIYLDALLMYYNNNVALALAAYNAGPASVNRYGGIPPYMETRRYVQRVIHDYNRRKRIEARQRITSTASSTYSGTTRK